jgi:hypothetical protein
LVKAIQERAGTYEVQQFMDLLGLLLEDSKNNLVTAAQDRILYNQAEAQTYSNLIRMLTRPSIRPQT